MELKATDYPILEELSNSYGWQLICKKLDERIKDIENILLSPNMKDIIRTDDPNIIIETLNYKKMERAYLLELKELPKTLMQSKIKTNKIN